MNIKPIYTSYTAQGNEYKKSNIGKNLALAAVTVGTGVYGARKLVNKGIVKLPTEKTFNKFLDSMYDLFNEFKFNKVTEKVKENVKSAKKAKAKAKVKEEASESKNLKEKFQSFVQKNEKSVTAFLAALSVLAQGVAIDAVLNKILEHKADK